MELFSVVVYFSLLMGLGLPLAKRFFKPSVEALLLSLLFGSICAGLYVFLLSHLFFVNMYSLLAFPAVASLITASQWRFFLSSLQSASKFLNRYLLQDDRWRLYFIILITLLIVWIVAMAYTPPRAADAMRYHLAQLSDIVRHQGFVFRPYIHYNFPLYFGLSFLPVFFLFKGVAIKLAVCIYFLLSLFALTRIAQSTSCRYPRFLILLLFLVPLSFHEAHIALNDWAIIFYVLCGFLFLLNAIQKEEVSVAYLAFVSLGFAFGIKYQVLIFLPWFCLLAHDVVHAQPMKNRITHLILLCGIVGLLASPFLIRNMYYLGNPVWPVLNNWFPVEHNYLYDIAQQFNQHVQGGSHSLSSLSQSIVGLIKYPLIPGTLWALVFLGIIFSKRTQLRIGLGILLYFILWWLMQPVLFFRFGIYVLPISLIAAVNLYEYIHKKRLWMRYAYQAFVGVNLVLFIGIAGYYSQFYFKYILNRDDSAYHRYTWYYSPTQWLNQHTAKDVRILVIVHAGQTYYLDRDYLRADPMLSGLLDWKSLKSMDDFMSFSSKHKINYIFYVRNGWPKSKAQIIMSRIMDEVSRSPYFLAEYDRVEKVYASRIRKQFRNERVLIYKFNGVGSNG